MLAILCGLMMALLPGWSVARAIVVLGDSISAGYGLDNPDQGWVGLLQAKLKPTGTEVVNAGISGDTSAGGLARVDALLDRYQPSVVLLELGGNDGLRGLPPAQMADNLGEIIRRVQARQAKVLLLGMRIPPNYGKRYNEMFEAVFPELAQRLGVAYVPFLLEGVGGNNGLMQPDGLHPNMAAQPVLLQRVWEKLAPLL
ncbi:MAG: arylesterase [Methylococcaceae bacterium]|nr:arylesterase [Methylococcaceae bacterium]